MHFTVFISSLIRFPCLTLFRITSIHVVSRSYRKCQKWTCAKTQLIPSRQPTLRIYMETGVVGAIFEYPNMLRLPVSFNKNTTICIWARDVLYLVTWLWTGWYCYCFYCLCFYGKICQSKIFFFYSIQFHLYSIYYNAKGRKMASKKQTNNF